MKKYLYVDTENTGLSFIDLVSRMGKSWSVTIFYSAQTPRLSFAEMDLLMNSRCKCRFSACRNGRPNAMDFCIMAKVGMNVEKHPKAMHLILSRDKGYLAGVELLRERGYYVDLSGIDAIRGRVNRMYDPFRNAFSRDGIVYAYPHDIFIASLTYHKSTFEKLGLTPPTTYEEYLDLCLTIQDDYEDQLMNVNIDPFVNGMDLRYLLTRYTDEQIRAGKTPVYQTGELERVLDKYLEVRETFENKEQFSADGVPLFYLYDLGALDDQSAQDYLPLTFEKDAQPLYAPLESDFSFYVLNPRGKHVQEAAEFILSYENTGTFPDDSAAEPMENPRYEKELEEMRGVLEDLEYELSQQKDEETQEQLEQMMEQQEENIREYEKEGRWQISPEYLEQCAKLAGNVYICDFNPILSAYEEDPGMFDNLTRERIPELLRNLDSRIRMILFENE